jgi:endogenous inhibitor of DNA gyrase (YacG/DUF329 family)
MLDLAKWVNGEYLVPGDPLEEPRDDPDDESDER